MHILVFYYLFNALLFSKNPISGQLRLPDLPATLVAGLIQLTCA